jgi:TonB-dependent receptor
MEGRNSIISHALLAGCAMGALAFAGTAQAQTAAQAGTEQIAEAQLNGVVTDAAGRYINGAEVRIDQGGVVARTDSEGRFRFTRIPTGTRQVTVTYFGMPAAVREVNVLAGQTTEMTVVLGQMAAGDQIVVTSVRPIAESEASALQLQRSSTSLISVVAADSIGRFPDQNIAAAVSRLPGIAVQRDQGQERFVSLRGARTSWTTIAFDGVNVISPAGRTTRFDTIPSSIASAVVVRKAVTADMPGETVAGNIDIRTRGAFDYPGLRVAVDAGLGFNELGGGRQYNLGGFISDRFFDDTVGVLLSASRYERDMVTDNYEGGWTARPDGQVWNNNSQNKLYRLTRSNTAYSGRIDWRPDDDHEFFINSVWTEFRDDELRSAYVFDVDDSRNGPGWANASTGNTPFQGTIYGVEIDSTLNSNSSRQRIFTNTLGGNHLASDWDIQWRLNYTVAQADSRPPFTSTWASPRDVLLRPSVVYDLSSDRSINDLRLFQTVRNPDGTFALGAERPFISTAELGYVTMARNNQRDETIAYTARIDVEREIDVIGNGTTFKFGVQYDDRTKDSNRTVLEARAADLTAAGIALPTMADFELFDPFQGRIPLRYEFRYFSNEAGQALFDSFIERGGTRVQPGTTETNYYEVNETVLAGYVMGTTFFDWGNIVAGVRAENVANSSLANVRSTVAGQTVFTPATIESDKTLFFPSAHFNWDVRDDMKVRLSFNTGAARPDYTVLRPNLNFNDIDGTVSGGNPLATPEKARGIDVYYEWYMPSRGFFSIGAYYKDVRDVLFDIEFDEFGIDTFDTPEFRRSTYTYNTTGNGGSGEIKGIEIAFSQPFEGLARSLELPDWMGGFGVQANVTFNDSKATTPDGRTTALPGASDFLYNVSGYYEFDGFSARVSWQERSSWLDSLGSNPLVGDNYWDKVGRLDFSMRYALNDSVEFYFDANNLLDEPGIRYVGEQARVIEYETFGARYLWGVRLDF